MKNKLNKLTNYNKKSNNMKKNKNSMIQYIAIYSKQILLLRIKIVN